MYANKLFELAMDDKEEKLEYTEYEAYTTYKKDDFLDLKNLKKLSLTADYVTFVEMAYLTILGREIDPASKRDHEMIFTSLSGSEGGGNQKFINSLKINCVYKLINSEEFVVKGKTVYNNHYFVFEQAVENYVQQYRKKQRNKNKLYYKAIDVTYHKVFLKLPLFVQAAIKKVVYKLRGVK